MKTYATDIERAQAAIDEFKKIAPMLTSFARAFTGNPLIKVLPQIGTTHTDGKFIYIEPPLAMADQVEHDKSLCNRHDGAMRAMCEACGIRESVLSKTFHEIAHNWAGTFEDVPDADKARAITDAATAMGVEVPQYILDEVREASLRGQKITYDSVARAISPFLDILHNALEDARVNSRMGEARPGFDRMRQGDEYEALYEGTRKIHPETGEQVVLQFGERSLDFQAAVGLYRMASGFEVPPSARSEVKLALADERLAAICRTAVESKTVRGPYDGAVRAFEILREYGLMGGKKEDDQEDETPDLPSLPSEEEPEEGEGGEGGQSQEESDRDDAGSGEDDSSGDEGDESGSGGDDGDDSDPSEGDVSGKSGDRTAGETGSGKSDSDNSNSDEVNSQEGEQGEESQGDGAATDDDSQGESDDAADSQGSNAADGNSGSEGAEDGTDGDESEECDGDDGSSPQESGDGATGEEHRDEVDSSGGSGEEDADADGGEDAADDAAGDPNDPDQGADAEDGDEGDDPQGGSPGGQDGTDGESGDDGPSSGDQTSGSEPGESGEQGSPSGGEPSPGEGEGGESEGDSSDATSGSDSEVGSGSDVGDHGDGTDGDDSPGSSTSESAGGGDSSADDMGPDDGSGGGEGDGLDSELGEGAPGDPSEGSDGGQGGEPDQREGAVTRESAAMDYGSHASGGRTAIEDESKPKADEGVDGCLSGDDPDDGPIDTGAFDNDWVQTSHDPSMAHDEGPVEILTPDEVAEELEQFFGHNHEGVNDEETDEAVQALYHVMNAGIFFDMIPRNVAGVRWHKYDKHVTEEWVDDYGDTRFHDWAGAWTYEYLRKMGHTSRRATGIDGDFEVPEKIVGAALQRARIAFANNARTKEIRNLKSGKVNSRVLGRRAPVKDPRLFAQKHRPGRRNYFVILGGDVSLSTLGTSLVLIKRAIMAQAEVLSRLGIPFEVIMHSADSARGTQGGKRRSGAGYEIDMYLVKEAGEPWNDAARKRLRAIGPDSNNLDGHTIQLYRKRLDARTETDRILMYYTDGRMPALNGAEEVEVLKRELKTFDQQGYKLMCVGVRTSSPEAWGLSTVRVDEDKDLVNVIKHIEKALQ